MKKKQQNKKNTGGKTGVKIQTAKVNRKYIFWLVTLNIVVSFLCFSPSINCEFTNWDDPTYVTENTLIKSLSSENIKRMIVEPVSANHHPLTMLSLAVDYHFAKLEPARYHIVNLIFHLLNVVLVFFFIYLLTGKNILASWLVSLWFGIHPMHVESVAWVSERKDVLYTFFFLASLIFYIRYINSRSLKFYLLAALMFVFSLTSKAVAVTLPVVFLLIDFYLKGKIDKRSILEKLPLLAISLLYGYISMESQRMAISKFETFSLLQRLMFACYGSIAYLYKLILPVNLSAYYPYPVLDKSAMLPNIFYFAPVVCLALVAAVYFSLRKTRIILFGALFYIVTIALVLQFVSVGTVIIADRYTYVPYIGLFFVAAMGISYIFSKEYSNKIVKYILAITLSVFTVFFMVKTFQRTKIWKDSIVLWTDVIDKFPATAEMAYKNRGMYYGKFLNDMDNALKDYDVLMAMNSKDEEVYSNLGNIYSMKNEFNKALEAYTKGINMNPENYSLYLNRAITLSVLNRCDSAKRDFDTALKLEPGNIDIISNRAFSHMNCGRIQEALQDYDFLINARAEIPKLYFYRGLAYFKLQKFNEALNDFLKSISNNPEMLDTYHNISICYFKLEDYNKAMEFENKMYDLGVPVNESYREEIKKRMK